MDDSTGQETVRRAQAGERVAFDELIGGIMYLLVCLLGLGMAFFRVRALWTPSRPYYRPGAQY